MHGIIPFARLFNVTLQAPAKEGEMSAFNLGGIDPANLTPIHPDEVPEGDRGDDFDPSLFEEQDDAPRKPAAKETPEPKPEGEGEGKPAGEGEGEPEGDGKPAGEVEEEGEGEGEKGKKPEKKPSRAQERIKQLAERNAALERIIAQKAGSEEVAATLADLETQAGKLDKDYHKALAEDPEKAAELMAQIRKIDRQIARIEAQAEADITVTERLEQRELAIVVDELTAKYPELHKGGEEFDQELTNEVNAVMQGLITTMGSKPAALKRAVALVMGEHTRSDQPAGLGESSRQDQVRDQRRQEGAKRTVEAANRQPKPSDAAGASKPVEPKSFKSLKDIEKASEEDLAKARGDEL